MLHTNDLHSHFRPENDRLGLGGIARIKSAVDKIRSETQNTLFVDGGDWSEGNIYYNLGAGTETLRMMDFMGYDVAVVGNHDWLNGPDLLLDAYSRARPAMSLVAANIDVSDFPRKKEFEDLIPKYVIKNVGGAKVAFIGIVTQEFIYDSFFKPVKIDPPLTLTRDLAASLKKQVDAVIVISHNAIKRNVEILKEAPDVDLVIGAHDHVKLTRPVIVERPGHSPGWVVEAGCWGAYLGRVDMTITPGEGVTLQSYKLQQMDSSVPEDSETLTRLEQLESALEKRYGPIFHDHVADNFTEISRAGQENRIGNFATDAYMRSVKADLALDQSNLIYGQLHSGKLRSVDFFNANPAIFNPATGKSWTLKTFEMSGMTLKVALNLLFLAKKNLPVADLDTSLLSTSGLKFNYSPVFRNVRARSILGADLLFEDLQKGLSQDLKESADFVVRDVQIDGQPIQLFRKYTIVAGDGILHAIAFLNSMLPGAVSIGKVEDSGIEDWRAMMEYGRQMSPITPDKIPLGDRIRTVQSDLGVVYEDVTWKPTRKSKSEVEGTIRVRVRNYGMTASPASGPVARLMANRNGTNESVDPDWVEIGEAKPIPSLNTDETAVIEWNATLPGDHGLYPLTVSIQGIDNEVNHSNDQITHWFSNRDPADF